MVKGDFQLGVFIANSRSIRDHVGLAIMAAVFVSLTMCSLAPGTTLVAMSFEEVVAQAEQIVLGEVTDIRAELTDDEKKIYTFVTLENVFALEGPEVEDGVLTLRLSGGHVENLHSIYLGMPEFKVGQQAILFVHLNGKAMCPLVGWTQGFFRVVDDGSREIVKDYSHSPIVGVDFMGNLQRSDVAELAPTVESSPGVCLDGGDPGQLVFNDFRSQSALSLEDFVAEIQDIRALSGFKPEVLPDATNRWIRIPEDINGLPEWLLHLDPLQPAPGRQDSFIPRALNTNNAAPGVEDVEAEVEKVESAEETSQTPAAQEMDIDEVEQQVEEVEQEVEEVRKEEK